MENSASKTEYVRLLHPRYYSKEKKRFESLAFRNFEDGVSLVDPICGGHTSGGLCTHLAQFYPDISGIPPVYWRIPISEFPAGVTFRNETSTSGDECHWVVEGISDQECKKWFKQKTLDDFEICVGGSARRAPTVDELVVRRDLFDGIPPQDK